MTDHQLIRDIEAAGYRCWPAAELVHYDGWQLRYADGFSRRGNSVYPAERSSRDYGEKLEWCRSWYADRGLQLVVRQNPATEADLDGVLAADGFTAEGRTKVMVASLSSGLRSQLATPARPSGEWWAAMADLWEIDAQRRPAWQNIINRIDRPAAYALVADGEAPIAAGLAVVDPPWVGLFEVIVARNQRRQGVGTELTRSLLAWGTSHGAERAFLQVVEENTSAIALYEALGFTHAYTYWYRRDPAV